MGYSNFKEGSPGAKKRDEIAETLKKDVIEKAGPLAALGAIGVVGAGLALKPLINVGIRAAGKKLATAAATKGASKAATSFKGAFKKPGGAFKKPGGIFRKPTAGVGGTAGSGGAAKGAGVGGAAKGAGAIRAGTIGATGATLMPAGNKRERTYQGTSVRH